MATELFVLCRSPERAIIKQKMVYAASKDALKKALGEGIAKEIQANDHGDLTWSSVLEVIMK
jgi:cofilin